jgi:tetratricopeptide (TPR) repeat protein
MPTKKNESAETLAKLVSAAYEAALEEYQSGLKLMQEGNFSGAKEAFERCRASAGGEPELADRAATYIRVCESRLAPAADEPSGVESLFREAVFKLNAGDIDQSLQLLTRALVDDPNSVDLLYVRACAWAKQGSAEKAVGDLRQAIAADPKVRFQAVNDPDFERIREEPAFIDIIEPTPTGV